MSPSFQPPKCTNSIIGEKSQDNKHDEVNEVITLNERRVGESEVEDELLTTLPTLSNDPIFGQLNVILQLTNSIYCICYRMEKLVAQRQKERQFHLRPRLLLLQPLHQPLLSYTLQLFTDRNSPLLLLLKNTLR